MNKNNNKTTEKTPKKITARQVAAMAGIVLLALLYLVTLAVAVVDSSASGRLLWICLFATVAIPILVWIYIWLYGKLTGRRTMSDPASDEAEAGKDGK